MFSRIDPMVRLLVAAMLLAWLLPVTGAGRDWAQGLTSAAVFCLFLLYGLKLARAEVLAGLGNVRLLVPLVLWVFGAMTLAGWGLWQIGQAGQAGQGGQSLMPPLLALGFLYLGVLPSTVQSATVYSSLAGGNVASSVIAAALLNILGVFVAPPLFALLAGGSGGGLQAATIGKVMAMMLLPFVLGQAAQGLAGDWAKRHKTTLGLLERGTIGLAVYVSFSGAVEQEIWHRIAPAAWAALAAGCGIMLAFGYGGAWALGKLLGLGRGDHIAMVFAGAQKSVAMGAPLATVLFPSAAAGVILLPLLVYHLAQMLVAAPVAGWLRRG